MTAPSEDALLDELDRIIRNESLTPLFQPIVDGTTQAIFGYEALIRGPEDSPLHSPIDLFETATSSGRLAELDFLCRKLSIEAFSEQDLAGKLFLNIMPASMLDANFREGLTAGFLAGAGLSPERVVIELTEHVPVEDYDLMRAAVAHYRTMGLQVALDDLGAKYSNLRQWVELRPEFVKIDRHFIKKIHKHPSKRKFLESIIKVARNVDCTIIAEGIESADEYHCLRDMQCDLMQGYYFARPDRHPSYKGNPRSTRHNHLSPQRSSGPLKKTAALLCRHTDPVNEQAPVLSVLERFEATPNLRCVTVINDDSVPVGILRQRDMLGRFANPFSHALYSRQVVGSLMDRNALVVEESTPLEQLSALVTETSEAEVEDFVIVDRSGHYLGTGNIIDLLREITALQVTYARQANPLTGLPGNEAIHQAITERLESNSPFCAVYCDLDNFKAYNDVYGYANGDQIILALARILSELCRESGFVGHIGGDDFIVLLDMETTRSEAVCHDILSRFAHIAPAFYTKEHQREGGIQVSDRQGNLRFFPFISVSMALHPVRPDHNKSNLDLADTLTELKKQAKKEPGNSLFIDKRR